MPRCPTKLGHKRKTVRKTLKEESFFPYRISVLHKLKPEDYSPHYDYCDWFFNKFGRNVETMSTIFFSDETWFHLSGYVNSQNYCIWSTNNPHVFEETSLYPIKVGVWGAISQRRVIGPIFFNKLVDSDVYTGII